MRLVRIGRPIQNSQWTENPCVAGSIPALTTFLDDFHLPGMLKQVFGSQTMTTLPLQQY